MSGRIISADNHYAELDNYIKESGCQSMMLVCDESLRFLDIRHYFDTLTDRLHVVPLSLSAAAARWTSPNASSCIPIWTAAKTI